jgi:hypothetical protein
MKKLYILGLLSLSIAACKPNIEPVKPEAGSADFTRYVAVGGAYTAGYSDGTLTKNGQENSFPAILAKQLQLLGSDEFEQPLLRGIYGYPLEQLVLRNFKGLCDTNAMLHVVPMPGALDSAGNSETITYFESSFNNHGVPGIRSIDWITPGYGQYNIFSKRFYTTTTLTSIRPIDEAVKFTNPTFFTCWIGPDEVLVNATNGGSSGTPITDDANFRKGLDSVLSVLTRKDAKGVVLNIPSIVTLPFFTTIPPQGLMLTDEMAKQLNDYYNANQFRFNKGASYFVIQDTTIPAKKRQIMDGEFILLTDPNDSRFSLMDSIRCKGWGSYFPIPEKYVITASERALIDARTNAMNSIIGELAAKYDLPLIDINMFFRTLTGGMSYNGIKYSADYATGGAFSLDGVHPTARGYALITNRVINEINRKYGSTLPMVDANSYSGVKFP